MTVSLNLVFILPSIYPTEIVTPVLENEWNVYYSIVYKGENSNR